MGNQATIFLLLSGNHCDNTFFFPRIKQSFITKLGHVVSNEIPTDISEIECFLADPPEVVTEKTEFQIRSCICVV